MGIENRDWYRDWHRERNGYTERADFRVSETQRQRRAHRAAWLNVLKRLGIGMLVIYGALAAFKNHVLPLL